MFQGLGEGKAMARAMGLEAKVMGRQRKNLPPLHCCFAMAGLREPGAGGRIGFSGERGPVGK